MYCITYNLYYEVWAGNGTQTRDVALERRSVTTTLFLHGCWINYREYLQDNSLNIHKIRTSLVSVCVLAELTVAIILLELACAVIWFFYYGRIVFPFRENTRFGMFWHRLYYKLHIEFSLLIADWWISYHRSSYFSFYNSLANRIFASSLPLWYTW